MQRREMTGKEKMPRMGEKYQKGRKLPKRRKVQKKKKK